MKLKFDIQIVDLHVMMCCTKIKNEENSIN